MDAVWGWGGDDYIVVGDGEADDTVTCGDDIAEDRETRGDIDPRPDIVAKLRP